MSYVMHAILLSNSVRNNSAGRKGEMENRIVSLNEGLYFRKHELDWI